MPALSILAPRRVLTRSMKACVHVSLQRLDALDVFGLLRQERIERVLALARGVDAALDADAADQLVHAERRGDDPDRAHDRARIGIDLIARKREQIAAGGGDILGEDIDFEVLLGGERPHALVDQHRLHGRAAGRVDLDGDGLGAAHGESLLDRRGRCRRARGRDGAASPRRSRRRNGGRERWARSSSMTREDSSSSRSLPEVPASSRECSWW